MQNKVFVVKNDKAYHNYQTISYGNNLRNNNNPRSEINKLFNSNNFIYKAIVKLKINNEYHNEVIIGRIKDNLITTNSVLIPIDSIEEFIIT